MRSYDHRTPLMITVLSLRVSGPMRVQLSTVGIFYI